MPSTLAETFRPLALEALPDLQDRMDVKYVVPLERFAALTERLRATHQVLEIDGRRAFRYHSTYFDTAELTAFRDHVQERRRRYKCRSREYVDSGLCTFEVKLKGGRGQTVKHRMAYDRARRDELSEPALEFLRDTLARSYGRAPDGELRPALAVAYTRITLAAPDLGERLTCDYDLAFSAPGGASGQLAPGTVIVESKSARGLATADRELIALGARPERGLSKYCLGVGFTTPGVKSNGLRPLLRRHFRAAPVAAVALALGAAAPAPAAELPKVEIRAAEAIRDDPKVPARMTIGKRTHRIEIELRGTSSLLFPKKSYAIETRKRVRLLGMPREHDWALNAYYADPTRLRDVLAHAAARRMGLAASRTRLVRVRLNGRPRGVYVLTEPPELSDRRVRGDALLELTEPRKVDDGDEWFRSTSGLAVIHSEPDEADKKKSRAARAAVEAFEAGDVSRFDRAAAIDYMLHAELFKNQDAFFSSTYVHQREDGKLALGPVWDFDLSAGNVVEPSLASPEGWLLPGRPWTDALAGDRVAMAARWHQLRAAGLLEALLRAADRHAGRVGAVRTLDRPVFRNQPVHANHAAAVAALKHWLVRRAAWMDAAL